MNEYLIYLETPSVRIMDPVTVSRLGMIFYNYCDEINKISVCGLVLMTEMNARKIVNRWFQVLKMLGCDQITVQVVKNHRPEIYICKDKAYTVTFLQILYDLPIKLTPFIFI